MFEKNFEKDFLGSGWKFPVQVDETTGRIKVSSYEEDIKEAIGIIIGTRKGERVMMPGFGCEIHDYAFSTLDYTTINQMENAVAEAIRIWEPRVDQVSTKVTFDQEDKGKVYINVSYVVRTTNNPYNLVYPYFVNEGFV